LASPEESPLLPTKTSEFLLSDLSPFFLRKKDFFSLCFSLSMSCASESSATSAAFGLFFLPNLFFPNSARFCFFPEIEVTYYTYKNINNILN